MVPRAAGRGSLRLFDGGRAWMAVTEMRCDGDGRVSCLVTGRESGKEWRNGLEFGLILKH